MVKGRFHGAWTSGFEVMIWRVWKKVPSQATKGCFKCGHQVISIEGAPHVLPVFLESRSGTALASCKPITSESACAATLYKCYSATFMCGH